MIDHIMIYFIENCIKKSIINDTKLPSCLIEKGSINSVKIRIFLNELCSFENVCYFQYGLYDGIALFSALFNNKFSSAQIVNHFNNETTFSIFQKNILQYKAIQPLNLMKNFNLEILSGENFNEKIKEFDVFYIESQLVNINWEHINQILKHAKNKFILVVNSYDKSYVEKNIERLIKENDYFIVANWHEKGDCRDKDKKFEQWYEGLGVFYLQKKTLDFKLCGYVFDDILQFDRTKEQNQNRTKQVIITRYKENIEWTKYLNFLHIIYNKNEIPLVSNSIQIQNISKEDYGYLKYIIDNYENLPHYMIFIQGHPFDHEPRFLEILYSGYYFNGDCFFGLCDHGYKSTFLNEQNHFLNQLLELPDKIDHFWRIEGAQFIVSRNLVNNRSKQFYQKILNMVENKQIDGYDLEFVWWIIFDPEYKSKI